MSTLTKEQTTKIVEKALLEVADFNGEIQDFSFTHFHDLSKQVFANKLVELIKEAPYHDDDGNVIPVLRYDLVLSMSTVNSWQTLEDCINYVFNDVGATQR